MIQANELRLGNLVIVNGETIEVSDINSLGINNEYGETKYYSSDLHPIPLSEDILLKCGFEKNEDTHIYYYKDLVRIDWFENSPMIRFKAEVEEESNDYYVEFTNLKTQYLHQLQNQVYFNTNEELTIN